MVEFLGNPILTTSAARKETGEPISDPYEIEEMLKGCVDLFVDGGSVYPDPSSVIDLTRENPEIIRAGKGDISQFS
jgi:tRNA A37 threonylcarbamoyladenosine synthetase subunit TsaC/SUA5/YrdC